MTDKQHPPTTCQPGPTPPARTSLLAEWGASLPAAGLYDPQHEHDACGVGFVVDMKGRASHEIVQKALTVLKNLQHRGACGCEVNTGDGAGILIQVPHGFLRKVAGVELPEAGQYGVGMLYASPDAGVRAESARHFEKIVAEQGQRVLGWRQIPTDNSSLGATSLRSEPFMRQVFIARGANCADEQAFERQLYIIRKRAHVEIRATKMDEHWRSEEHTSELQSQ